MSSGFFANLGKGLDSRKKCRVAIPLAQDEACAYAVCRGVKEGVLAPVLIGDLAEIKKMYGDACTGSGVTLIEETNADKACKMAVTMVREGKADILMKGLVPTSTLLKAVLNSRDGIKKNPLLSHVCFFEAPNYEGVKILTDAAINIAPDVETLTRIGQNAIEAWNLVSPRPPAVALLSANEKVSEKVPSTGLAQSVAKALQQQCKGPVAGPISLDLAISPESANIKKYGGPVQGNADILIAPRIEVGNVLYKSLQYFVGAEMAGLVYGAKCPVVLTSRSDSNDTKFYSLLLGVVLWHGEQKTAH